MSCIRGSLVVSKNSPPEDHLSWQKRYLSIKCTGLVPKRSNEC